MHTPGKSAVPNEGWGEQGKGICEIAGMPLEKWLPWTLQSSKFSSLAFAMREDGDDVGILTLRQAKITPTCSAVSEFTQRLQIKSCSASLQVYKALTFHFFMELDIPRSEATAVDYCGHLMA